MMWFVRNWDQVAVALWQHIVISVTSLSIAFAISLVVGIVAARNERIFRWSLGVSGLLYTIPTLAFLALLIPIVGLGRANAIICMITDSQALLNTGQIIFGIIVIGIIGLISDFLFKWANRRLFPWSLA